MSSNDYESALRLGQKEYRARVSRGQYPYLQVLDEVLRFTETQEEEPLGLVSIPIGHIVGTKTEGRRNSFASNFMPLLAGGSEFAAKWAALSDAHLEEGIQEPILAYEYLNRFYVQEGNKRVSVMKYFGAVNIPGIVRRILPKGQDTAESRIYADFLEFYRLTKINYLWFSQPGRFQKLLAVTGGAGGPWRDEDRSAFFSAYARFRKIFKAMGGDRLPGTTGDAFLAYLNLHDWPVLHEETDAQLKAGLTKSWTELAAYSIPEPVEWKMDPVEAPRSILTKLLPSRPDVLQALFLYEKPPEASAWAHAHEEGRRAAEEALEGRVETRYRDNVDSDQGLEAILEGIAGGANVIFTTSSQMLPACLKAAAEHPAVKILNCSVYSPHPIIRTYYGRMYEIKFLAGLVAGAMTRTHKLGYVADYPIYGTTAAINAFALGARMADPWVQVFVEWRAQREQGLWERLVERGVDMISGLDLRSPVDLWRAHGLYYVTDGVGKQIATWSWNWGKFYERILKNILDGKWKEPLDKEAPKAINYWWGLSAGVVDLRYTQDIPQDTLRLAGLLQEEIISGRFQPFQGRLTAQGGRVVREAGALSPEEIVKMDWLSENVVGDIPAAAELTGEAQKLIRLQGVRPEDREECV